MSPPTRLRRRLNQQRERRTRIESPKLSRWQTGLADKGTGTNRRTRPQKRDGERQSIEERAEQRSSNAGRRGSADDAGGGASPAERGIVSRTTDLPSRADEDTVEICLSPLAPIDRSAAILHALGADTERIGKRRLNFCRREKSAFGGFSSA